jgi:hypothetical protein
LSPSPPPAGDREDHRLLLLGHHRSVAGVTYLAASPANLVGTLDLPGEHLLCLITAVGSRSKAQNRSLKPRGTEQSCASRST